MSLGNLLRGTGVDSFDWTILTEETKLRYSFHETLLVRRKIRNQDEESRGKTDIPVIRDESSSLVER